MEKEAFEGLTGALSAMTLNNPIFIFVVITIIWFMPGIIARRISSRKLQEKKRSQQAEAIAKLYPPANKNSS